MNRYQIYLDPKDVRVLDDVSEELKLTRSAVIRDVISRAAREYEKVLKASKKISLKKHPLMRMVGIGRSKTGDVAKGVDEIYLQD
jgi:hypothetical protein